MRRCAIIDEQSSMGVVPLIGHVDGLSTPVLRNHSAATVTRLSLPASIRDANHQEWDGPLLSDGPEAGAGSLAAELAGKGVAAECLEGHMRTSRIVMS